MESPSASAAPLLIGWKEHVDFPEWGIHHVRVKIDTGAHTSALDVNGYEMICMADGVPGVRLDLALSRRHPERIVEIEAPLRRTTTVRNSGGHTELRPVIEVVIRLGSVKRTIEVTLTQRTSLRYRMLLGRRALANCFLVDAARTFLLRP